jgi:hypothetical protein
VTHVEPEPLDMIMTHSPPLISLCSACALCFTLACGDPPELNAPAEMPEARQADPDDATPRQDQGTDTPDVAGDMAVDMAQRAPEEMSDMAPDTPSDTPPDEEPVITPPPACDGDAVCVDSFPHTISDTTVGGATSWSSYGCAPETNESGPERAYRVIINEPGFLSARLTDGPAGVDIDVHVLMTQDAQTCLDRGHLAAGAALEPGEYWVVADSWTDAQGVSYAGEFELTLNLTHARDLEAHGIAPEVAADALKAFGRAWARQESKKLEYAVTDFSIHSRNARTWVMDLASGELLFLLTIGHGKGSVEGDDLGQATIFSNIPASNMSSLGMMRAAERYTGDFGYSMRLDGLEPGFNDKARARDIVVHPDERNRPEVTAQQGWLSPSRGCPSLDPATSREVVDTLSEGGLMFFWYPDSTWRQGSALLD